MSGLQILVLVYGVLSIALGYYGYQQGSNVSLYAGGAAGVVAIVGALVARTNEKVGFAIAAVVCLAMLGNFVPKLLKEFKWLPGGVMVIASAVVLLALIFGHFAARKA